MTIETRSQNSQNRARAAQDEPSAAPASLLNSGNLAALAETPTKFEHERALAARRARA